MERKRKEWLAWPLIETGLHNKSMISLENLAIYPGSENESVFESGGGFGGTLSIYAYFTRRGATVFQVTTDCWDSLADFVSISISCTKEIGNSQKECSSLVD